jgi:hypothetical protein
MMLLLESELPEGDEDDDDDDEADGNDGQVHLVALNLGRRRRREGEGEAGLGSGREWTAKLKPAIAMNQNRVSCVRDSECPSSKVHRVVVPGSNPTQTKSNDSLLKPTQTNLMIHTEMLLYACIDLARSLAESPRTIIKSLDSVASLPPTMIPSGTDRIAGPILDATLVLSGIC